MNVKQFSLAIFVAALSLGILPARADDATAAVPTTNTLVIVQLAREMDWPVLCDRF